MTQPTAPPPPPPTGPPPGGNVNQQVQGPAIGLLVTAAIGGLLAVISLLLNILGMGMAGLGELAGDYGDRYWGLWSGGVGMVFALVSIGIWGFVAWAALQMKELRGWAYAVAASIVALIPCFCPTCVIGIPIGIWALVVLMKPEVKAAFTS